VHTSAKAHFTSATIWQISTMNVR